MRTEREDKSPESYWHLDRRIPLALVITLVVYLVGAVWLFSALDQRVLGLEKTVLVLNELTSTIDRMTIRMDNAERRLSGFAERNTIINEEIKAISNQTAILVEQAGNTSRNLDRLQDELSETNRLLRSLLIGDKNEQ